MKRFILCAAVLSLTSTGLSGIEPPIDPPATFANSIGMKFVWIRPGSFVMGSPDDEEARNRDETQHKVTLTKGFYLGVHTVTQEQWQTVMGANPSVHQGQKNLPVDNLSWINCEAFLDKLSKKEGRTYRLPTEAEWEFACRAGTKTPFSFGGTITTDQANFNGRLSSYGNVESSGFRGTTAPVGSYPANAWGLCEMHGNVWQWCADWYGDYPTGAVTDPRGLYADAKGAEELVNRLSSQTFQVRQAANNALREMGTAALSALRRATISSPDLETRRRAEQLLAALPKHAEQRVLRGGSFATQASFTRSANRFPAQPDLRYEGFGFRVATDLKAD